MKLSRYYFSILALSRENLSLVFMTRFYANYFRPQGGTLIFSYIRRLGRFLGVQNFELI